MNNAIIQCVTHGTHTQCGLSGYGTFLTIWIPVAMLICIAFLISIYSHNK